MNKISQINDKTFVCLFLLLCGVLYFGLEQNYIPSADDLFYKFYIDNPSMDKTIQIVNYPHRMIESWSDIIPSQINQWYGSNGRFIVHATTQILTSFFPQSVFVILSTLMFCFLLWGLGKLSCPGNIKKGLLWGTFALVIVGTDSFKGFMASIAFNLNYLWSATAMLGWLVLYEYILRTEKKYSIVKQSGLFLLSMFVASLQESFTIGIAAGVGLSFLMRIRNISKAEWVILVGFAIGACLNIFAPSNLTRSGGQLLNGASHVIVDTLYYKALWMFIITFAIHAFVMKKRMIDFIKQDIVFFTPIVVTWIFGFFIAYNGQRQFTIITLCAIILTIRLWTSKEIRVNSKVKYSLAALCSVYCIAVYPMLYQIKSDVRAGYDDCIDQLMNTDNRVLYSEKYELALDRMHSSWIGQTYGDETVIDYFHCFSAVKTKGQDIKYIKTVMPLNGATIISKCDAGHNDLGLTHLANGWYGYKTKEDVEPKQIVYKYLSMQFNPFNTHIAESHASFKVKKGDYCYYMIGIGKILESYNVEIQK